MNRLNPHFIRFALCLASALVMVLLIVGIGYYLNRQRTAKAIEHTVQQHAARAAAVHAQALANDSARYSLQGKRAELNRTLTLLQQLDDSVTRSLPAAPELPADPPRQ